MATEGDLTITLDIQGGAASAADANAAATAIQGVENAQTRNTQATLRANASLATQVRHLNTVQNLAFRGFVNIGRLAGANSALAHTMNALAFGTDIAFASLQAYLALTRRSTVANAAAIGPATGKAIAETGPAAPFLGPAIVAAIIGGMAAVVAAVASTPGAASGAIVTGPTLLRAGERGKEALIPLPPGGGFGGGNINIEIGGRSIRDALVQQDNRDWVSGRA